MTLSFNARIAVCMVELALLVFLSISAIYVALNHTHFPDIAVGLAIVNVSAAMWLGFGHIHYSDPWIKESMISMEAGNVPG